MSCAVCQIGLQLAVYAPGQSESGGQRIVVLVAIGALSQGLDGAARAQLVFASEQRAGICLGNRAPGHIVQNCVIGLPAQTPVVNVCRVAGDVLRKQVGLDRATASDNLRVAVFVYRNNTSTNGASVSYSAPGGDNRNGIIRLQLLSLALGQVQYAVARPDVGQSYSGFISISVAVQAAGAFSGLLQTRRPLVHAFQTASIRRPEGHTSSEAERIEGLSILFVAFSEAETVIASEVQRATIPYCVSQVDIGRDVFAKVLVILSYQFIGSPGRGANQGQRARNMGRVGRGAETHAPGLQDKVVCCARPPSSTWAAAR